jgi:hypothetical protein
MFYRQDGHVFYILTFYNPADNFSIMYDFTTQKFFDLTDWDASFHPARQIAYFNNQIYFVSLKQGSLMVMNGNINSMTPEVGVEYEIPRIRITDIIRLPGAERFIANLLSFTIESGVEPNVDPASLTYKPRIDLTMSKSGGQTYSSAVPYYMKPTGQYNNQPRYHQLGQANQLNFQFRFWGLYRFVINNALLEIRQ